MSAEPVETSRTRLSIDSPYDGRRIEAVALQTSKDAERMLKTADSCSMNRDALLETDQRLAILQRLDASAVMVNEHTVFRADWMPFAGRHTSGYGVGCIGYTMRDMPRTKLVVMKNA